MKLELRSLRVINCGPLRDVCIHFNTEGEHPVTVLAGANGSGKTTALELIAALADTLDPDSRDRVPPTILERTGYAQMDWLVDGRKFSVFYGQRPKDAVLASDYFGRPAVAGQFLEDIGGDVGPEIREMITRFKRTVMQFPYMEPSVTHFTGFTSLLYFPYDRAIHSVAGSEVRREVVYGQWVYRFNPVRSFEGSLDSYLVWLDYAEPEDFARVIEFLNSLNLNGKIFSILRKDLKVVVTTPDGGTHYLEHLSSGEQNILIMLLELRRRLRPGSIVLIDEIENGLHPAFQKQLAESLKRVQEGMTFQLIVTTHALPFVEIFGPGSTRILTEF